MSADDDRHAAPASTPATTSPPIETIRRGIAISPELREGIGLTLFFAVRRLVRPGDRADRGPADARPRHQRGRRSRRPVRRVHGRRWRPLAIVVTSVASYLMTSRLFRTAERGLATLRIKAFRHVHDLPLLTQNTERRGALVSRVTTDVDQVSQFLVFGGLIFIVSIGQMLVATVVMVVYSWQLALVVWVAFAPLFLSIRWFQRKLTAAYAVVRRQVGVLLSAISEPVVGAEVVRAYAVEDRTQDRIDTAIDEFKAASVKAQQYTVVSFSLGGLSAGLANAGVLIVGRAARLRRRHHRRHGARVRVPGDPVRRPGPDGHPDPHRRPERHRQLAARDRHPRHPGRPRRPRGRTGQVAAARPDRRGLRRRGLRLPRRPAGAARHLDDDRRRHPASPSSARPARASRPSPSCSPG